MFHVKHFGVASVAISVALCTTAVGRDAYLDQTFGFDVQRNIIYGTGSVGNPASGEIDLLLDLYEPVGLPGLKPGLVYIRGGSFDHGDKASFVPASMAEEYASRGYVVASINYRMRYDDPTYEPGLWDDTSWEARAIPAAVNDAEKEIGTEHLEDTPAVLRRAIDCSISSTSWPLSKQPTTWPVRTGPIPWSQSLNLAVTCCSHSAYSLWA